MERYFKLLLRLVTDVQTFPGYEPSLECMASPELEVSDLLGTTPIPSSLDANDDLELESTLPFGWSFQVRQADEQN